MDDFRSACMSIRNVLFKKVADFDMAKSLFKNALSLQKVTNESKIQRDCDKVDTLDYQGFVAWLSASCIENKKVVKFKKLIEARS